MPSANGVYSLPVGYLAVTGATIQASQHNPPLEDIAAALTARLSRDGTAAMTGALQAAAGAAATPSYTFAVNNSKGLYSTANGIGVSIGGVQVAEFLSGGINGARFIGELIALAISNAPALTVLPFGQTLSRTTYAALWAVAQIEISGGNQFYNNGDGSTTFGIGDLRGRSLIAIDSLGGSPAGRLTNATMSPDGTTIGATGGTQNRTLITANLPAYTPSGSVAVSLQGAYAIGGFTTGTPVTTSAADGINNAGANNANIGTFTGNAQGGTSQAFSTIPPTMAVKFALYAGA